MNEAESMKSHIFITQLLVFALLTQALYAQRAKEKARIYFSGVRSGANTELPVFDTISVTDIFRPYLADSTEAVRIKSRELLFAVAKASTRLTVQSQAIEHLLAATHTNDVTTTGIVISMIKTFEQATFTDSAKMHIRRLLKAEGAYLAEWIKMAGFLGLKDLETYIRAYSQPGNHQSLRWSALLSLARMGDKRAALDVLARVKKLGVNDNVVYKLFPDLIFTRDADVINYVVGVLHQDASHCLSADVEKETAIPCGYRIMEQLIPIIEKFPLTLGESGDLEVDDYASAWNTARQWFLTHKEYSIRKEKY